MKTVRNEITEDLKQRRDHLENSQNECVLGRVREDSQQRGSEHNWRDWPWTNEYLFHWVSDEGEESYRSLRCISLGWLLFSTWKKGNVISCQWVGKRKRRLVWRFHSLNKHLFSISVPARTRYCRISEEFIFWNHHSYNMLWKNIIFVYQSHFDWQGNGREIVKTGREKKFKWLTGTWQGKKSKTDTRRNFSESWLVTDWRITPTRLETEPKLTASMWALKHGETFSSCAQKSKCRTKIQILKWMQSWILWGECNRKKKGKECW